MTLIPCPQLLNLLATLGENPYIRYYAPHHHPPLGPLAITATPGSAYASRPAPASANPAPSAAPEPKWKAALSAVQGGKDAPNFSGEQICRRIALQVQADLDDYQALNPDFPVRDSFLPAKTAADVCCVAGIESSAEVGHVRR